MPWLTTTLLVAALLVGPATALVFTVGEPTGRRPSLVQTWCAALMVGFAAVLLALVLGAGTLTAITCAVVLGGGVLAWRPVGRDWATRGLVAWSLSLTCGALYLVYVLEWTLTSGLTAYGVLSSSLLWLIEVFVFLVGIGYLWEFVDVLSRRHWVSHVDTHSMTPAQKQYQPFVSLHVPTHNEPPDLVIATLERLLVLDYDDYEVLVVDNNTTDPDLWRPVEAFCATDERLVFIHLENWPGFKSGALNHALTRTDPRAELIGIVDADYLVAPDFLAECAPLFAEPRVAFVQTPQDYRDWEGAAYFRRLYHSYGYFFEISQRSRNERNGAIFGGTMGLIRRGALEDLGGWDEWCITEDAELSLRLLRIGGLGLHVHQSFGRGVMPLTFEALKRQRFRWCFGGIQILRLHARSLLPGRADRDNELTLGQRWAYLVGGLQWFGDLVGLMFTAFLLVGALDVAFGGGLVIRRLSGPLLLMVVVTVGLGLLRSVALVRRASNATWGEALGAFGLWLALGWTVAQAAARGLVARQGAFLRTPKTRGELTWHDTLRGNPVEILAALVCAGVAGLAIVRGGLGPIVVGALLLVQAVGYAAAPVNSLAAIRADLPDELRRRRAREWLPSWTTLRPTGRPSLLVGAAAALILGVVMLAASPVGGPDVTRLPQSVRTPGSPSPSTGLSHTSSSSKSTSASVSTSTPTSSNGSSGSSATASGGAPSSVTSTRPASGSPTAVPTGMPTGHPTTPPATPPRGSPTTHPTPTRTPTR